jgi:YVTN family beta-propeller protein
VIEFRVLGPFEVVEDGRPVGLGGQKHEALLAALLLERGHVVSTDRLIDALWGETASATAAKTVQVYISNLRKALGDGLVVTRGRGYLLDTKPGQLDLDRFEELTAAGRAALDGADPRGAVELFDAALQLWRGTPLGDLAYESFAQAEVRRLEEDHLSAIEDRIDARLALGEHARLVGELEALVRHNPLRERLHGQLMLALYRSGRQADALERYKQARRLLIDELGIEPGPGLKEMEQAILSQDPKLDPPRASALPVLGGHRGKGLLLAGAALLLVVVVVIAVELSGGSTRLSVAPNSVAIISAHSNALVGAIPVGSRPGAITFGAGSLWVANQDDQTVSRVDPRTLSTLRTIPVGNPPTGVAAGPGRIWVATSNVNAFSPADSVSSIDPQFNSLEPSVVRIENVSPGGSEALATQGDQVWAAPATGLLTRIDAGGHVAQRIDPNASPTAIAIADGAIWVTDNQADNVTRIDPSGLDTPIAVGNRPSGIAIGDGAVWVADSLDNALVRIDPSTRSVTTTIAVGDSPAGVAVGAGSVWVANSGSGTVSRIDPRTGTVIATIPVGGSPQALTVADGRVWVTVDTKPLTFGPATGAGTLRIDWPSGPASMDPAVAYDFPSIQVLQATCAQLMNYPDQPGPAGSRPAPEVAKSLPAVSADGKTYTFTIRPGFRFSPPSDQAVTAETFKDSLERALNPKIKSPWVQDFGDIAGMGAYESGAANHISGIAASGDRLTIRLVAPRPDLPARLAERPGCAVPSDTPIDPNGVRTVPSAGPYYVQSFTPGQSVMLARNPNYHGRRPRHFQRIEVAMGMSTGQAVAAVKAGRADYTALASGPSPNAGLARTLASEASTLAARYGPGSPAATHGGQRYFVNPLMQLDYFAFNTHRALFADRSLRQAVNFAIDRRGLAALGDGFQPLPDTPTDHYLPPGMPGYRRARVYPLTPDPAAARRLATGGGRTAVLYTCNVSPCPEQAQIVKRNLAAIGLQVQIRTFPLSNLFSILIRPGEPFDLAWVGWVTDFPDPYGMLNAVLENGSIIEPTFTDPVYAHRLAAAARLAGPERYLTYGKLDLDLARNGAPLAAFGNLSSFDFFSARIGCQTFGFYGMDLAALCVRPG